AEDGIRDLIVTGVQTCALPIYLVTNSFATRARLRRILRPSPIIGGTAAKSPRTRTRSATLRAIWAPEPSAMASRAAFSAGTSLRSEERRVGKERRGRWARAR